MKLRPVVQGDEKKILGWRNDPVTRANSFTTREITAREHSEWFRKAIAPDSLKKIFLIEEEGAEVGVAALNLRGRIALVDVNIAPEHRGKGVGTKAVEIACEKARELGLYRVDAEIKQENAASIRTFEKTGFSVVWKGEVEKEGKKIPALKMSKRVGGKIVAVIQARAGSTRLPGKVLKEIGGKSMLARVVERVKQAKNVDEVVVATTAKKADLAVADAAEKAGAKVFFGSEEDVLERYLGAGKEFGADVIVRITSDCPFVEPKVVDEVVEKYLETGADYASNVVKRSFPRGLDAEVFSIEALEKAAREARKQEDREHVTLYIREHPNEFKAVDVEARGALHRPELRLTVDEEKDLELARKIVNGLGEENLSAEKIIAFLDSHPEIKRINDGVKQKEK